MAIVNDLLDLFDAKITMQPGLLDWSGSWLASGANQTLPCRYEGGPRMVRDSSGQQVVSSLLCIVGGMLQATNPSLVRFTIPATFLPQTSLIQAIRIDIVSDETGPICAEVSLP